MPGMRVGAQRTVFANATPPQEIAGFMLKDYDVKPTIVFGEVALERGGVPLDSHKHIQEGEEG